MALRSLEYNPKSQSRQNCKEHNQDTESESRIDPVEDHFGEPFVCDPRLAIICKRKEICARDRMSIDDVFACFQVPPKVAVTQGPRREEKRVGKDVHTKNSSESLVHGLRETRTGVPGQRGSLGRTVSYLSVALWFCVR